MERKSFTNSFVEVDLGDLRNNIRVLKNFLSEGVKQMAVVKADAYGHGAVKVARAIEEQVDWFAVNDVDEGLELREAGINNPVLVFGVPTDNTAPAYPDHNLTATISSNQHFDLLRQGTKYHLNFDTGMGRLGLYRDEITKTQNNISTYNNLTCTGIYSHFATADDPGSAKAEKQLKLFTSIRNRFDSSLLTHMGNTGGTAFYPASHFDMVRNGIGIYGYPPGSTPVEGLKPAIRWQSELVQIKQIREGETVSYGARWRSPEDGYIGVVPVGYEEGVPRVLSGQLEIAVEDSLYPVVGTVTMNYIMIFLGSSHQFEVGQPVEVLGGSALTADHWASRCNTIPYEIVSGISRRVPRRYV